MEYAASNFEIAMLARGLDRKPITASILRGRITGSEFGIVTSAKAAFTEFIRPCHRDGSWLEPFEATDKCRGDGNGFYEGNSWTDSCFVPQHVDGPIEKMGGARERE